ncbi:putative Ig domain-containing protein [Edaphobacter bradus]|uniref:putative Ig domain-containing protein n=1 Tax=Edaphobacter bradus TaxID=2259016 RepID=UPI0021DFF9F1|nr:putative Ig domain-containing protein [Edaphobacter bradus]
MLTRREATLISTFVVWALGMQCPVAFGQSLLDMRTPKAPPIPHINGPKVYGARPGHPFLYRIPCTGTRPIHFSAMGLPSSLKLDETSGIISGTTPDVPGEYATTLEAANSLGNVSRQFKIVVGDQLGLTPQMGWNDWYSYYEHPTESDIREAADAMIKSGMADYGYQFVDIDDAWARKPGSSDPQLEGPARNADGDILSNARFPNMGGLTEYIHSLGLKAGIYSGPGPLTCAKFEASYGHEDADARQFSKWGFDLLKYDWCSYGTVVKSPGLPEFQEPYRKMSSLLEKQNRDIVLNICQYGMGEVWKWGRKIGGMSWRTTGDLGAVKGGSLPGFYSVGFANAALDAYAGPGGWNDPDYILIGTVGDANDINLPAKPTHLTQGEQYSYMSMWSLMAAPLFFSGEMTKLDDFTLNVLCNSEVIDIDQDSLGRQAKVVRKTPQEFVLAKPLDDGSVAVGLFNLSTEPLTISVPWSDVERSGTLMVRDVWRHESIGAFANGFSSQVPAHDVALVRISPQRTLPVSPAR